jgi:hypothetical protein
MQTVRRFAFGGAQTKQSSPLCLCVRRYILKYGFNGFVVTVLRDYREQLPLLLEDYDAQSWEDFDD